MEEKWTDSCLNYYTVLAATFHYIYPRQMLESCSIFNGFPLTHGLYNIHILWYRLCHEESLRINPLQTGCHYFRKDFHQIESISLVTIDSPIIVGTLKELEAIITLNYLIRELDTTSILKISKYLYES